MTYPTQVDVLRTLSTIRIPASQSNLVQEGLLSALSADEVEGGGLHIRFVIETDPAQAEQMEKVRQEAVKLVEEMEGVTKVTAILAAHKAAPEAPSKSCSSKKQEIVRKLPEGVSRVIAVASGKGGVGKSTTAVNLAIALAQSGMNVGLLDADVYGPSVPRLIGASDAQIEQGDDDRLIPFEAHGIKVMSIGFLVEEESPMLWRGPMVHSALKQMLYDVAWGELDVLILDMPPGTGDAALSVAQQVPLTGAVIVSTPQDIALLDVRKGIGMFQRVGVPVLGLIENMSYFECPHCHGRTEIFGHGGAEADAARLGLTFLGHIPLDLSIRETSDAGTPLTASVDVTPVRKTYIAMAEALKRRVN